jgi:CBS domain-containing protein
MNDSIVVSDLMTKNVITLSSAATANDAVKIMGEQKIGSVVVKDADLPIGIVTERDLLSKVLAYGLKPSAIKVGDIMTKSLIRLVPDKGLREACKAMIAQKGRLLILENEHLIGIAQASDLTRGVAMSGKLDLNVEKIMTRRVFSVDDRYSVGEATRIMNDK